MNHHISILIKATLLSSALFSSAGHAVVIYENNFQSGADVLWSNPITESTPTPYPAGPRSFLGQFNSETVSLTLSGLSDHNYVELNFDLYLIRSWDGSSAGTQFDYGNDLFTVNVQGGPTLLSATFSNGNPAGQSFGSNAINPTFTGASETYSLGYVFNDGMSINQVMDSVYHFSYLFNHSSSDLSFDFTASGLQPIHDESWGLDNVKVSIFTPVPEPENVAMILAGLVLIASMALARRTQLKTGI